MTITERIAAAIKPIIDEDRRADRVRIAALERTIGFLNLRVSNEEERANGWQAMVADLNKQLDELNEKCAALVVENKRLREDDDEPPAMVDLTEMARVLDECCVQKPGRYDNSTLRIDTDMSDPQPGKLLVVRLDRYDVDNIRDKYDVSTTMSQWVGFLVETPAVEVKRAPKVGDSVRLTVSGWEGETAKIVDVKEQSAALALDEDVKRFSFDCFEVIE